MALYDGLLFIWLILSQQVIQCFLQEDAVAQLEAVDSAEQPAHIVDCVIDDPIGKIRDAMLGVDEPVANVLQFVRI